MKIVLLKWNSFCNEDMIETLQELGHQIERVPYWGLKKNTHNDIETIRTRLKKAGDCIVFSFNYFPEISVCCQELGLLYVSWVYDSPYIHLYSYTIINSCNRVFLFDYGTYEELRRNGIETVYYMPLGVNEHRMKRLKNTDLHKAKYAADIAFVGSLYSEQKHDLYSRFEGLTLYTKGYLEGAMKAQQLVQGQSILQELLSEDIVQDLERVYPTDPNATTALSPEAIYADYVLARQVTARERAEILTLLGEHFSEKKIRLYTHDKSYKVAGVMNEGQVDYYDEMPYVFQNSGINLNISLRSIRTGIPLRCYDIMGCGGFLLTNYQAELLEYFVPGEDFVFYEDMQDLAEKCAYYLSHDKEREQIARNGQQKVFAEHSFRQRVADILAITMEG